MEDKKGLDHSTLSMAAERYSPQVIQTAPPPSGPTPPGSGGQGYGAGTGTGIEVESYSPLGATHQLVDPETIYTKQNIIGTYSSAMLTSVRFWGDR